jgi:hypothetical protein
MKMRQKRTENYIHSCSQALKEVIKRKTAMEEIMRPNENREIKRKTEKISTIYTYRTRLRSLTCKIQACLSMSSC